MSKKKSTGPSMVDQHVGRQVRILRVALGLSQTKLGEALDLSFQQVQKYENGVNRISASKLFEISKVLKVAPGYFFEGLEVVGEEEAVAPPIGLKALRLAQSFDSLPENQAKSHLYALVRSLAGQQAKTDPRVEDERASCGDGTGPRPDAGAGRGSP